MSAQPAGSGLLVFGSGSGGGGGGGGLGGNPAALQPDLPGPQQGGFSIQAPVFCFGAGGPQQGRPPEAAGQESQMEM